ncbi:MAG: hypothetical protein HYS07_09285, partial [Chlamydiae bacterium]|nr:hypothetical protein [Chlamydiota bacterium]MBI3277729.1 hypothetical protein [Chlamydiota bacterium]
MNPTLSQTDRMSKEVREGVSSTDLQEKFEKDTQDLFLKRIRLCCSIAILLISLFEILDFAMVPQKLKLFLILRLTSDGVLAILWACSYIHFVK